MVMDGAVAGGIIAVTLALIRIIEKLIAKRMNDRNGDHIAKFVMLIAEMHGIVTRTSTEGEYLIYGGIQALRELRQHTIFLETISKHLATQSGLIDRRVDVCDRHTELLSKIEAKL